MVSYLLLIKILKNYNINYIVLIYVTNSIKNDQFDTDILDRSMG